MHITDSESSGSSEAELDLYNNPHSESEEYVSDSQEDPSVSPSEDSDSEEEEFVEYEFPEETDITHSGFDTIPSGAPEEQVIEILKHYLDNYEADDEPIVWYTNKSATYEGNMPGIQDIVAEWNSRVEDAANVEVDSEGLDDAQAQLQVYKHNEGYQVYVEYIMNGYPENCLHYDVAPERICEVLKVFYSTGYVYDRNMATIYGEDN